MNINKRTLYILFKTIQTSHYLQVARIEGGFITFDLSQTQSTKIGTG